MTALPQQIGFIGGGNMAEAIAGALIRAGVSRPDRIRISDPSPERRHHLQQAYGLATTTDNTTIFNLSAIIVLAVKPQVM
ncbi:MAG: pyrroline-5-carboxylate reductase family protein, partial [Desulfosudaceae bacterium]